MSARLTRRGALAASLAGSLSLAGCGREIGQRPFRVADGQPDGYPTVQALEEMGRLLDQRTNGRLCFTLYPGGQLGEEVDTLEITMFGGLDLNRVNSAPLNAIAPATVVPSLPFLFRDTAHMRRALDGPPGQAVLDSLRPHGLIGLCFYDSGERCFYGTRGPIRTPADLRGLKMRVQSSDLFVALVEALGGDPTPMSYGEVYQALVTGVIDGAENNWPSYEDSRHFEVAPYYALTNHVMTPEVLVASARSWARLSPGDRALVADAARESVPFMRARWDERQAAARRRLLQRGVEVNAVDREAFQARVQPVWDRFARTPELRRLVEDMLAMEG